MVVMRDSHEGVSVIVGTLMLILITVIAAASLAIMISEFEKDEMERQAHLNAVESEDLRITAVELENNLTDWGSYIIIGNDTEWNNWSRIIFDVSNMNIKDSKVIAVRINDDYALSFYDEEGNVYDKDHPFVIEATKTSSINVSLLSAFKSKPKMVSTDETIKISLISLYYNGFNKNFKNPVPSINYAIESEDILVADQLVLVLDGRQSFDEDGSVVDYLWTVQDWSEGTSCTNSTYTTNVARIPLTGEGPFKIWLKVTDNDGLSGRSPEPVVIPKNSMYTPPMYLEVSEVDADTIAVCIKNINNVGLPDQPVTAAVVDGNVTLSKWFGITDGSGEAEFDKNSGMGTIRLSSGKLAPQYYYFAS
ncbi:MAG: type IV pilin [Methanomicrobiaceae archaeon]|nr:type IV pilin [Methanomicrobiaceae archaeon]